MPPIPFQPVATPVDTFTAPEVRRSVAGSELLQVSAALAQFNPVLREHMAIRFKQYEEASALQADKDYATKQFESMKAFKEAVDAGHIAESDNPWYIARIKQNIASAQTRSAAEAARFEFENSTDPSVAALRTGDSPSAVEQWFRGKMTSQIQDMDVWEAQAALPILNASVDNTVAEFMRTRTAQRREEMAFSNQVADRSIMDSVAASDLITDAPVPLQPGNIDLHNRPVVQNADGSISTVRSISIEEDGHEVLIPTVSPDGKVLSNADAIALYRSTGQHLGIFKNSAEATAYAKALHNSQSAEYSSNDSGFDLLANQLQANLNNRSVVMGKIEATKSVIDSVLSKAHEVGSTEYARQLFDRLTDVDGNKLSTLGPVRASLDHLDKILGEDRIRKVRDSEYLDKIDREKQLSSTLQLFYQWRDQNPGVPFSQAKLPVASLDPNVRLQLEGIIHTLSSQQTAAVDEESKMAAQTALSRLVADSSPTRMGPPLPADQIHALEATIIAANQGHWLQNLYYSQRQAEEIDTDPSTYLRLVQGVRDNTLSLDDLLKARLDRTINDHTYISLVGMSFKDDNAKKDDPMVMAHDALNEIGLSAFLNMAKTGDLDGRKDENYQATLHVANGRLAAYASELEQDKTLTPATRRLKMNEMRDRIIKDAGLVPVEQINAETEKFFKKNHETQLEEQQATWDAFKKDQKKKLYPGIKSINDLSPKNSPIILKMREDGVSPEDIKQFILDQTNLLHAPQADPHYVKAKWWAYLF